MHFVVHVGESFLEADEYQVKWRSEVCALAQKDLNDIVEVNG